MHTPRRFDRRDFLRRLGAAAVLLPYLPVLKAHAATSTYPKRTILVFNGTGTINESLWPSGTETQFTFPAGSILEPLAPVQANMIAIRNLQRTLRGDSNFGSHERNTADVFTGGTINPGNQFGGGGWAHYASIDQIIAATVPQPTPYSTLEFAVMPGEGDGSDQMQRVIFAGSDQPITPMLDPYAAFQRLFGDFGKSQAQRALEFKQKRSILDWVGKQLGAMRQHLPSEDYQKVDSHLTAVRALEASLQPGGSAQTQCAAPTVQGTIDLTRQDNFPMIVKLQNEIMLRALTCDMTRITSMQYSRAFCLLHWGWLGINKEHHQMTHDDQPQDRINRTLINRYYAQQVLYMAQTLKAIPEGAGTMLDNTVIVWANESGNDAQSHDPQGAPTILVGGGGGYFKTGRFLANDDRKWYAKQVLLSVCHAMGATSLTHLGDPAYGDAGPMTTLSA